MKKQLLINLFLDLLLTSFLSTFQFDGVDFMQVWNARVNQSSVECLAPQHTKGERQSGITGLLLKSTLASNSNLQNMYISFEKSCFFLYKF